MTSVTTKADAGGTTDEGRDRHTPRVTVRPRRVSWLLVAGVALAALNLRTAITSVGTVLDEITVGLGMSGALAGALTTLPVLCFALFGALTPSLIRRFGEHHVLVGALAALTFGLGLRALVAEPWSFLALSAVALSGGAVGNVLLPTLVKQHFPERVGTMTTLYTTALALGTTIAAAGTVPIEQASGSWQLALGSYAALGAVAAVPWLAVLRHEPPRTDPAESLRLSQVLRTAMGWQSVLFFGTQSTVAYIMFGWFAQMLRDNGMDAASAGGMLSYLTALAVPTSLVLPGLMARARDHRGFVGFFFTAYAVGLAGLWVSPLQGIWVWTTCVGLGMGSFPQALTFFAVRTRTAAGTAAMSATSQSLGYLMAGAGPFLFGLLHEATGSWHAPLGMVAAIVLVNMAVGMLLGRPRYLEDSPRLSSA
ncbi:CP family cyanate transporter-like MFS transporter [Haloactinospora alba]|uniref:CP family cyanate transporter-like MFS transporter n=1 Tax=Haloactinospora alba TaxID=405555 RepID=A0A543NI55_9ACTN|nr:MFS transporter [Haloactinospora alba]TQN31523.1 CP family cyanate transporter-like MFS transporter [Haloactinospora alba]